MGKREIPPPQADETPQSPFYKGGSMGKVEK